MKTSARFASGTTDGASGRLNQYEASGARPLRGVGIPLGSAYAPTGGPVATVAAGQRGVYSRSQGKAWVRLHDAEGKKLWEIAETSLPAAGRVACLTYFGRPFDAAYRGRELAVGTDSGEVVLFRGNMETNIEHNNHRLCDRS